MAISNRQYAIALGRAFAGAVIFSLPLLMTMEMWWLGFSLEPWRVIQFVLAHIAILYGLSKVAGFEESHNWQDDILDAFSAYFVAAVAATCILYLIGAIRPEMAMGEVAGMIAVQTVPASFGAMIGAKLMGEGEEIESQEHWRRTYSGQLFLMLAGALFLSFTVAPTEETSLIAYRMSPWLTLVMILLSIVALHTIHELVGRHGKKKRLRLGQLAALLRYSLPGYAIAIAASSYILWSFGSLDDLSLTPAAMSVAVLALPASIGAAIARVAV